MSPQRVDEHDDGLTEFFVKAAQYKLLTPQQEKALGAKAFNGDRAARNQMVEHNLRLAISIAKRYRGRGIPFADLVQEAVIGLHRAAEKFDPDKGFRFSTYATWWCQHFAQRAIQNRAADIRVPWQVQLRRAKILRHLDSNPAATPEELAEIAECTVEQVYEASHVARTAMSLDVAPSDDDDDGSHALIADPHQTADPSQVVDDIPDHDSRLDDAMKELSFEEQRVLRLRFGFDGSVRSRKEIAEALGIDERAVSRHQREAMKKLRAILSRVDGAGGPERGAHPSSNRLANTDPSPVCSRKPPEGGADGLGPD